MSISPAKVRALVESKVWGARHLDILKRNHHKTLITILVANNLVNILAASFTTLLAVELFGSTGVGIATGVLTLVIIIGSEILPKSLATHYAKPFSLATAPFLYALILILTPIIWALDVLVKLTLKLCGNTPNIQVTDDELIAMAVIGEEEGSIDEHERELIENVLEFNDIRVEDVMTPRIHIAAMPEEYTLDEAVNFAAHKPHSRFPVYRGTLNRIVGMLTVKELIMHLNEHEDTDEVSLRNLELPVVLKVSSGLAINKLFHRFKKNRTHMAMVQDKDNNTVGLITMEDLLEELVGDIEDETDREYERVVKIAKDHYQLSGRVELDELSELTGLTFDYPEYRTLGFLLGEKSGKPPVKGEQIFIESWEFTVLQTWKNTVLKVDMKRVRT